MGKKEEIVEIDVFELKYKDQIMLFRVPSMIDIIDNNNDFYLFQSLSIANSRLLEKLYIEGDTAFYEDEDYLYFINDQICEMIEDVVGKYRYVIGADDITINIEGYNEIVLSKPSLKDIRTLKSQRGNENFTFSSYLERLTLDNIIQAELTYMTDKKVLYVAGLIMATQLEVKEVSLKKKSMKITKK